MANTCSDVPELTISVAEAQAKVSEAIAKRDLAKARLLASGKVWEGSSTQKNMDEEVAEQQAKLAEEQAKLAEAQADCAA